MLSTVSVVLNVFQAVMALVRKRVVTRVVVTVVVGVIVVVATRFSVVLIVLALVTTDDTVWVRVTDDDGITQLQAAVV